MITRRLHLDLRTLVVAGLCISTAVSYSPTIRAQGAAAASAPLLYASDLVYQGAFRLPQGTFGSSSFDYGGTALTFNPVSGSLFMVGHPWQQQVAEVSIPSPGSRDLASLPTAAVIQPFADPTEGRMSAVGFNPGSDTPVVGGLLAYGNRLYESVYLYYDASASQVRSHFVSGLNLSATGDVSGPYQVGDRNVLPGMPGAGFFDGYMALVPNEWQSALGGPVLAGNCCIPIISRTSYGPAAFAIDPAALGTVDPLPASPLVYYPGQHPTLGDWDSSGTLFNGASQTTGVVFPQGTRSVLFFGRVGLGSFCYGESTSDPSLDGAAAPGGDRYCYDPADSSKGTHGFPYAYFVWAYDALDLAAVRSGQRQPWEVQPYATWTLDLPFAASHAAILGAAYDPTTNRIFLSQAYGDGSMPLVQVFSLGAGSSQPPSPTPPPSQPTAPPSVTLTSPASGTTISQRQSIQISANAADSDGTVASVSFYAGSTLLGTAIAAPYSIDWSNAAAGVYRIFAVATDDQGNTSSSDAATVTVQATTSTPPKVTLSSPRNGSTYSLGATLHLSASAGDSDGAVTSVAFYVNGSRAGTSARSPYTLSWTPSASGTYRLVAVATDNDGNSTDSSTVTVTVRGGCQRRCS
jgi:hypothetical protein